MCCECAGYLRATADDAHDESKALIKDTNSLIDSLNTDSPEDDVNGLQPQPPVQRSAQHLVKLTEQRQKLDHEEFLRDVVLCKLVGSTPKQPRDVSTVVNEEVAKRPRLTGANDFDTMDLGYRCQFDI